MYITLVPTTACSSAHPSPHTCYRPAPLSPPCSETQSGCNIYHLPMYRLQDGSYLASRQRNWLPILNQDSASQPTNHLLVQPPSIYIPTYPHIHGSRRVFTALSASLHAGRQGRPSLKLLLEATGQLFVQLYLSC